MLFLPLRMFKIGDSGGFVKPAQVPFKAAILAALLVNPAPLPTQEPSLGKRLPLVMYSISSSTVFGYVRELASEKYEGRLTGTPGFEAAARWAVSLLSSWQISPGGDGGTYLQSFPDPYTLVLPGAQLSLLIPVGSQGFKAKPYTYERDFFPGSTSDSGSVTAEVVYVGYGITAPELKYDEYREIDVKGKIVLVEPEVPVDPDRNPELFMKWRPYSFHDYKVRNAKEHGAAGMIYDYHIANPNCVFIKGFLLTYAGRAVVDDLFAGTGKNHRQVLRDLRAGHKPASFATGKIMTLKNVTEHHPEGIGFNVIGRLEGSDPTLKQGWVIIGAHLDHLGLNDKLMPGANDNASGVAVLLGAAQPLARLPRSKRSILFILFGAEEQGVRGSGYYVAHPVIPNNRVKGFINLESVGRGERIIAGGGKNNPELYGYVERNNDRFIHRPLTPTFSANLARPRQDAAHFMWAGVPTLSFGTADAKPLPYATYHTTMDTPENINPEILKDLARLLFLSVAELADAPATP
jgi:hypothetical protein